MDLLTTGTIAGIKAALRDVTDTFFKVNVTYKLAIDSLDIYNEDRKDEEFAVYQIPCGVVYPENQGDELKVSDDGKTDQAQIRLNMNFQDLQDLGLINDSNYPKFQIEKDYFIANGKLFTVSYVGLDGFFDNKAILAVVHGIAQVKQS